MSGGIRPRNPAAGYHALAAAWQMPRDKAKQMIEQKADLWDMDPHRLLDCVFKLQDGFQINFNEYWRRIDTLRKSWTKIRDQKIDLTVYRNGKKSTETVKIAALDPKGAKKDLERLYNYLEKAREIAEKHPEFVEPYDMADRIDDLMDSSPKRRDQVRQVRAILDNAAAIEEQAHQEGKRSRAASENTKRLNTLLAWLESFYQEIKSPKIEIIRKSFFSFLAAVVPLIDSDQKLYDRLTQRFNDQRRSRNRPEA